MQTVYFVRHGESEHNKLAHEKGTVGQLDTAALSELGKQQAQLAGRKIKNVPFDIGFSSGMTRARETADIISAEIGLPIETLDFLQERIRPKEVVLQHRDDPKVKEINQLLEENFHDPEYKYSNEENFFDVDNRAKKVIDLINKREEENILIITHGLFLRYIIARVIFGGETTSYNAKEFLFKMYMANTGITTLRKKETDTNWHLWEWNNHDHIKEV